MGHAARVPGVEGNAVNDWNILGHEFAVRALTASIESGRVAHVYLLTGIHGIGKTTLARAFAQTLQCTGPKPPCGECNACQKILRDRHPDVRVIEGVPPGFKFDEKSAQPIPPRANDRERRTLRIDQIRALQRDLSLSPFEGRYKIAIVRRFEEANEEAANAFLKTLEEPPAYAFIVLTARDASLLLPTIVSRCQILAMRPLSAETIKAALVQRWGAEAESARLLSRVSAGQLGWAVRASADASLLAERNAHLDELVAVLREGRAERLSRAEKLANDDEELPALLELWLGWWRDVLLVHAVRGDGMRITNVDRVELVREHAEKFSLEEIHRALKSVRATAQYLAQNVNAKLAMGNLMLELPSRN
jgi:DNA polymerase-3 subunit delta'